MEETILHIIKRLSAIERKLDNFSDKYLDMQKARNYTSCSASTLRRNIDAGKLSVYKNTGKLLFKRSDLDKWLQGNNN